jgi:hypothetical protein
MSGAIGLTPSAQYLDDILLKNNPSYRNKLLNFIGAITKKSKNYRNMAKASNNNFDAYAILNYQRDMTIKNLDEKFKNIITEKEYSLALTFIYTVFKLDFTPNTKTQLALQRKEALKMISK